MTPERWQRVKDLFRSALQCEPSRRAAFFSQACAGDPLLRQEVESLLASDEQAGDFMVAPALAPDAAPGDPFGPLIGRRIGSYQILREIGRGGMGAVYLAERADTELRKQVAIKLIKRGMDTDAVLRRFRHERQILSDLDHPNIVKLLDGGATEDGLSYFIMDYVAGLPIDQYCLPKLSTAERLKLFRTACSAVQYAHEQGVVHRDLKPSNILVTADGTVKLLDFGIAKLLNSERRLGTTEPTTRSWRPMTPEYASPEQVRGEAITPTSDVYSLGVLLYELLTGHPPYRVTTDTPQEIERVVCETEPERPSAVVMKGEGRREASPNWKELTGDLDNIVLMALRKEPERRYASVAAFSEDIGRHLEGQPVIARPDTFWYRSSNLVRRRRTGVLAGALAGLLLLGMIGGEYHYLTRRGSAPGRAAAKALRSVAVLPLANLSGDPAQEYFADGMTEALITRLTQIEALRVVSRTSVMAYKGVRRPLPEIAQKLHVEAVIEGSVQKAGEQVRITVQLIEAATDRHLWAQSYVRDLRDVLALQSEVARAITQEIKVGLTPQEQRRLAPARPVRPEAYDAYLKGRYYFGNKWTEEGLKKSAEYFQQAITQDPEYAPAYGALAECYVAMGGAFENSPKASFTRAQVAAEKALALDDQLAEAHTALGAVKMLYEWDVRGAEKEYRRALELNPGYANAHNWYGQLLAITGRHEANIAEKKRALELDPLSLKIHADLAGGFYYAGQYDQAIEQARKVIDMDANFWRGYRLLGSAYEQKGMYEEAIAAFQKSVHLSGRSGEPGQLGHAYAMAGKRDEAQRVINELKELRRQRYVSPWTIAAIYTGLGEKDQAFEWLNRAYEERAQALIWLKVQPRFRSLHSDPRFADLLRRLGL